MAKKKKKGGNAFKKELPEKFVERLSAIFGVSRFREIEKTFTTRPTTFRVNTLKSTVSEVLSELSQQGFKVQKVMWLANAYILLNKSKRELTDTRLYTDGKIYIQSMASMVPPIILDPQSGEKVLDLTAAPGSKTSQIAALMGQCGELIANDKNKVRFFKLKHNMELLGVADEREGWKFTLRMEHGAGLSREYENYFDKILLDAPCSAEARFDTSDPKSFGYWSERKIKEMAYTQRILIRAAWHMLKPGGTLVYSTCTFAPEENEIQIEKFVERTPDAEIVKAEIPQLQVASIAAQAKNIAIRQEIIKNALRIMPTSQIEGFFVVKMRKKQSE